MKYFRSLLFVTLFQFYIFSPITGYSQEGNNFNLNIDNGLPSNHVYGVITDRHGYLWMATSNGVVRYNGYELKIFNLSNGLPNEDVWEVIEDRKGRIWLGNISYEMGYIYNNIYHKVFLKGFARTMYPKDIRKFGNSIIFHCDYDNNGQQPIISVENNDTIFRYNVPDILFGSSVNSSFSRLDIQNLSKWKDKFNLITIISNQKGEPLFIYRDCMYKVVFKNGLFEIEQLCDYRNSGSEIYKSDYRRFIINDNLIAYDVYQSSKFYSYNIFTPKIQEIDIKKWTSDTGILLMYYEKTDTADRKFYIFSNKNVLQFECRDTVKYIRSFAIKDLVSPNISGSELTAFNQDKFWGNIIGTTTGLWINYKIKDNIIKRNDIDLTNYSYIGGIQDSVYFWWNNANATLAKIDNNKKISYRKYPGLSHIYNIVHYRKDTFILTGHDTYFLSNGTGNITMVGRKKLGNSIFSTIVVNDSNLFLITSMAYYNIKINNNIISRHYIDWDRYNGLIYDSVRKQIWAYNYDKILIHRNKRDSILPAKKILEFGVSKIMKIVVDNRYGNIFFKGQNNISMYNCDNNTYTNLFQNYNTKDAIIDVYKGKLIVAGRFGIIFNKILGLGRLSPQLIYPNIKSKAYSYVYSYQISSGNVLLNTDKGVYQIKIPADSEINNNTGNPACKYNFILYYNDSTNSIRSGDTLFINQNNLRLQFDIINPYGNGQVKYTYKLSNDTIWHELNANELQLPVLSPDNYYKLSIVANDNVWKSNQLDLNLYIRPYWWQTKIGKRITWLSVIIFIIVLFSISVLVTRKLVLRATKKRQLQMELELKSIYAQINPHFIFNTLNSALLLVSKNKMEEAYTHISKFSRLLRGYIKSSRNKLITVAEEVKNLKNYIELQQVRFKDKFEYEIVIDQRIEPVLVKIPSLLLQPFVENAINHGILNRLTTGHLKISFYILQEENEIICTIEDDGIGRKHSKYINDTMGNKRESYGDLLIKDLVSVFNKYEHMNIEIRYTDKEEPSTGTIVTIQIKNPHYVK